MNPLIPENEAQRLQALGELEILDTLPEACFDRIVALAAGICETPIALFTLVDEKRQWFKSSIGLDIEQTSRTVSFCAHAVASDSELIVQDATEDPRFVDNPLVTSDPSIRFYAGIPVHSNDDGPVGTLCVIDSLPRSLSKEKQQLLESLAREIEAQLRIRKISLQQRRLIEERAILTNMILHDAKGVFGVVDWGVKQLVERYGGADELIDQFHGAVGELQHLCEGIAHINEIASRGLTPIVHDTRIRPWFESIAKRAKMATQAADMAFASEFDVPNDSVKTDLNLLDRIVTNLYQNAIQACRAGNKILLRASMESDDRLLLIVEDNGPGVPADHRERIFEPYFSSRDSERQGEGLGLAICQLVAQALGGSVEHQPVEPSGARFVVDLPTRCGASREDMNESV